jgi:hypothetical protein
MQQQHPGQHHHQQLGKEESDSEGSHISSLDSDAPGQLKHSDSLLLLTQVSDTDFPIFPLCCYVCMKCNDIEGWVCFMRLKSQNLFW